MRAPLLLILCLFVSFGTLAQQAYYGVTPGTGYGLRFWNDDAYKIHMGYGAEYFYGPVTSYSIKSNMSGGTPDRGWTWGVAGSVPVMAVNTYGTMQLSSGIYVGPYFSSSQPAGRIAATGHSAELSLSNRQVTSVVESPTNGERWVIYNDGTPTDGKLRFWSGGDKVTIAKEGKLGIGTSSPDARLEVDVAGFDPSKSAISIRNSASGQNWSGVLSFSSPVTTAPFYMYSWDDELQFSQRNSNGTWKSHFMIFQNSSGNVLFPNSTGNVGIGTTTPDSRLTVRGTIHTQEVKVDLNGAVAPDYVFEKDYSLTSLEELKSYIEQYKHLPEIPSAKEMDENGINLKEMNLLLLKKVEELTLHVIELNYRYQLEIKSLRSELNDRK